MLEEHGFQVVEVSRKGYEKGDVEEMVWW